jgi:hypothetical protein
LRGRGADAGAEQSVRDAIRAAFGEVFAHKLSSDLATLFTKLEQHMLMPGAWADIIPAPIPETGIFRVLDAIQLAYLAGDQAAAISRAAKGAAAEYDRMRSVMADIVHLLEKTTTKIPKPGEDYDQSLLDYLPRIPAAITTLREIDGFLAKMKDGTAGSLEVHLASSRQSSPAHEDTVFAARLCTLLDQRFSDPCCRFVGVVTAVVFDRACADARDEGSIRQAWYRDRKRRAGILTGKREMLRTRLKTMKTMVSDASQAKIRPKRPR